MECPDETPLHMSTTNPLLQMNESLNSIRKSQIYSLFRINSDRANHMVLSIQQVNSVSKFNFAEGQSCLAF